MRRKKKKKKQPNWGNDLRDIGGFFHELNEYYFGEEKERSTPLDDDEKIELACQLGKAWIKEKK